MNIVTPIAESPDYGKIKTKQNGAWSSGDYGKIGITLQITGEELAEAANIAPGSTVLDVAAGNGNATLAFARRWCVVTSTDYVATLLEAGRQRADAEGLDATFRVADAENLPFDDGQFDGVVSTFGVMFAPNQQRAAAEMVRVCRSGGKIALANWTPDSFIGALFKTIGKYAPAPAGLDSPTLWGARGWVGETFKPQAQSISIKVKRFGFRYPSPQYFVDFFRTFYGPVHKTFLMLENEQRKALNDDILDTIAEFDIAEDGTMLVPSDYAEIVIVKA
ncbi:class I SAM-dependent methyltransferase [Hoeflea sp. TYP-13]|uniref:class I SAM-dependent methyltransferase n=1 Tax=Hoeflea sp. TYP-13 TaxID=3230023 RepID=UPI0034C6CBCB